ncbi:MAG: ABC transporter ATP-binding protein, partial [Planctomycetes bacterium]|nr:ABC transporter ATP-binding protein [Planctomycetota bacterium]
GKTTLLRVLATLTRPDEGELHIGGINARKDPARARAHIGFVGHDSMLDGVLTMRENLVFFGRLYGVPDPAARAAELIERFAAAAFADAPAGELSRGQEQAAALCRALVHRPGLLLLDEPSTGLDSAAQTRLAKIIAEEAARGACVLFSTHDAALLPAASQTLRMEQGRLVAGATI